VSRLQRGIEEAEFQQDISMRGSARWHKLQKQWIITDEMLIVTYIWMKTTTMKSLSQISGVGYMNLFSPFSSCRGYSLI